MQWLEYSSQLYKAPVVPWFGAPIRILLSPFLVLHPDSKIEVKNGQFSQRQAFRPTEWPFIKELIKLKATIQPVIDNTLKIADDSSAVNEIKWSILSRFINEELFLVLHVLLMSIQRMKSEIINYYSQVLQQTKPLNHLISRSIIQTQVQIHTNLLSHLDVRSISGRRFSDNRYRQLINIIWRCYPI